jgi:predicted PurR-regulated permease PerM
MMEDTKHSTTGRLLVAAAALVVIVAGMKAATPIVIPFLLSLFIALICAPPLFWLNRKGVPSFLAALLVIVAIMGVGAVFAAVVGASLNSFSK